MAFDDLVHCPPNGRDVGHVERVGRCGTSCVDHISCCCIGVGTGARGDRDGRTSCGQGVNEATTDSPARSRDERHPTDETEGGKMIAV